jgi:hypothetical protein
LRVIQNARDDEALAFAIDRKPFSGNGSSVLAVQEALQPVKGGVCAHCGGPAEDGNSLFTEERDGVIYELHGFCMDAWLGKEDDLELPACLDRRTQKGKG